MSSTLASLAAGAQLPIIRGRTIMICPAVELNNEFGPTHIAPGWKTSTLVVSGGLNVGLIALSRDNFQVVPTAGLGVYRTNMKVEYPVEPPTGDVFVYRFSVRDTTAQVTVGVGVRGGRFAITPAWTIPLTDAHESVEGAVRGVRYLRSTFRLAFVVSLF